MLRLLKSVTSVAPPTDSEMLFLVVCVCYRVISLFGLVLSLSGIAECTHRPQGVIIVGIYMSSNYYLLILYLSRKELCR